MVFNRSLRINIGRDFLNEIEILTYKQKSSYLHWTLFKLVKTVSKWKNVYYKIVK